MKVYGPNPLVDYCFTNNTYALKIFFDIYVKLSNLKIVEKKIDLDKESKRIEMFRIRKIFQLPKNVKLNEIYGRYISKNVNKQGQFAKPDLRVSEKQKTQNIGPLGWFLFVCQFINNLTDSQTIEWIFIYLVVDPCNYFWLRYMANTEEKMERKFNCRFEIAE